MNKCCRRDTDVWTPLGGREEKGTAERNLLMLAPRDGVGGAAVWGVGQAGQPRSNGSVQRDIRLRIWHVLSARATFP